MEIDQGEAARLLLTKQAGLIDADVRHRRWQIASEKAGVALKALTGLAGLAVAGALGFAAWDASQSRGMVIDAFAIPPDMAARGLTGQVVASRILDRMTEIQLGTDSQRAPNSFARSWDGEIKVEIPQTGITLSELRRELRAALGHDVHVAGDVVRTADGLAVTVRAGLQPGLTFTGPEAEFDALLRRAAEAAFERTEPYRYAVYIRLSGRRQESEDIFRRLINQGTPRERAWSYVGLANAVKDSRGSQCALSLQRNAEQLGPALALPPQNIGYLEAELGHPEAARPGFEHALSRSNARGEVQPRLLEPFVLRNKASLGALDGDYAAAIRSWQGAMSFGPQGVNQGVAARLALAQLGAHDVAGAQAALSRPDPTATRWTGTRDMDLAVVSISLAIAREDWSAALGTAAAAETVLKAGPGLSDYKRSQFDPLSAYALARSGDLPGAQALIASTPLDSYDAVIMRGRIAELARDRRTADHWFAQANRIAPHSGFADLYWGRMLLARGDAATALAKAAAAHRIAPRFADPLELTGEALLAQGEAKRAAKSFAEAAKLAPRWGRLHLKWAQALAKLGKAEDARAQRTTGAGLDLTAAERAELNAMRI